MSHWLSNLAFYSLQIGILIAAGGALLFVLRMRLPQVKLLCWQGLLVLSLLLPLMQPWAATSADGSVSITQRTIGVRQASAAPNAVFPWETIAALVLGCGVALRLTLFGLGLARLQRYRRSSIASGQPSEAGVRVDIRISDAIPGPVTFGFLRPVVLLPSRWAENEAVLYHELIHVRRKDWLFMACEEIIRGVLWFHPAIWWALAQIQLAREETVDRQAVQMLNSRERYLETLLAIAAAKSGLDLAPAPLFLRKRHLHSRVASLMREVTMSRIRLQLSLAGFIAFSVATGVLAVRSFPLRADDKEAKQESQDKRPSTDSDSKRINVKGDVMAAKLVRKVTPAYPKSAKEARVQGVVRFNVVVAKDGTVQDIQLVSGDAELAEAAEKAVRQWVYETTLLNGEPVEVMTQVDVHFTLTR